MKINLSEVTQNILFLLTIFVLINKSSFQHTKYYKVLKCTYTQRHKFHYKISDINLKNSEIIVNSENILSETSSCESYAAYSGLNSDDMQKMIECTSIDFSKNEIDNIEFIFGSEFGGLRELIFDYNNLSELPEYFLHNLLMLKKFSIRNNFLEFLPENFFTGNKNLEFVDFSGNKLLQLSVKMFKRLENLRVVSFYDNLCINSGYPMVKMETLINKIEKNCDVNKNFVEYLKSLMTFKEFDDMEETKVRYFS